MEFPGRRFEAGETIYSDWFSREGDCAFIRAQLIDKASGNFSATITFYTKNSDNTGNGDPIASKSIVLDQADARGHIEEEQIENSFDELIRYKIVVLTNWASLRIFYPVFYDDAVPGT